MAKFLFKYATRSRPNTFKKIIGMYNNFLSQKHQYEFIITMDNDDATMNNHAMKIFLNKMKNTKYFYGNSKGKVEAINADINKAEQDWQILFLISDDMEVQERGFDDIIYQNFQKYFPDYDGCLHFNDGNVGQRLNTLTIMGRKLYDYFGYIYHPSYMSLWCDNEYDEITKSMGKVAWIDKVIVRHKWVGDHAADALHHKNETYYGSDEQIYKNRKAKGFPK